MIHRLLHGPIRRGWPAAALALGALALAPGAHAAPAPTPSYSAATPSLDTVLGSSADPAPWTLGQGDVPLSSGVYQGLLPTFRFGAANATTTVGSAEDPNYSVYPGAAVSAGSANDNLSGSFPYASGFAGDPGPLDGYCSSGGANPETGSVEREPAGMALPMSPYYFPFIMRNPNAPWVLTGFFDYRPKDADEAIVVANSYDGGHSWHFVDERLELNPGVCADGIQNDNGEGHPYVLQVHGQWLLYTLNRVTGDTLGQGLLVHRLNWRPTLQDPYGDPISGLPRSEAVDSGPNPSTAGGSAVGYDGQTGPPAITQASATVSIPYYNAPSPTGASAANPVGASIDVGSTAPFTNYLGGPGGTVYDVGTQTAYDQNADGADPLIQCGDNATSPQNTATATALVDCWAFPAAGQSIPASGVAVVQSGDDIVAGPEVPSTAGVTNPASEGVSPSAGVQAGLQAPDGIIGTVPASALPASDHVPHGASVVLYGEKLAGYYAPATTENASTLSVPTAGNGTVSIPVSAFGYTGQGAQTQASLVGGGAPEASGQSYTAYLGYKAATPTTGVGIATVSCTGADTASGVGAGDELTGCSVSAGAPTGASSVAVGSGYEVGAPGACVTPGATLQQTGEGSLTKASSLLKNNEDYTVIRAAYTTNGIDFTDLGIVNGLNDPAYQGSAGDTAAVGESESDTLRFVASRGSIVPDARGGYTMFMSGADCQDGDSDSFQQVFTASSRNGIDWSAPAPLLTDDPTFSASAAQETELAAGQDDPLGISAYYSGRVYDPNVIPDGPGRLTMVFSGYRTAKPLPSVGTSLGTDPAAPYVVGAQDPALYRNILTTTLTESGGGWGSGWGFSPWKAGVRRP